MGPIHLRSSRRFAAGGLVPRASVKGLPALRSRLGISPDSSTAAKSDSGRVQGVRLAERLEWGPVGQPAAIRGASEIFVEDGSGFSFGSATLS